MDMQLELDGPDQYLLRRQRSLEVSVGVGQAQRQKFVCTLARLGTLRNWETPRRVVGKQHDIISI